MRWSSQAQCCAALAYWTLQSLLDEALFNFTPGRDSPGPSQQLWGLGDVSLGDYCGAAAPEERTDGAWDHLAKKLWHVFG